MTESVHSDHAVWASRAKVAFGIFAIVGAFFLVAEHRAHVLPFLPWLLLAACPLMHMFMHGGHGHGQGHTHGDAKQAPSESKTDHRLASGAGDGSMKEHNGGRS